MKVKLLTLEKKLTRFPPCVCRMLARHGESNRNMRLLEDAEISKESGLTLAEVRSLTWAVTWEGVQVGHMLAFSKACGVDFASGKNLAKHYRYLSLERPFNYLRKHKDWEPYWSRVFQHYAEELERIHYGTQA